MEYVDNISQLPSDTIFADFARLKQEGAPREIPPRRGERQRRPSVKASPVVETPIKSNDEVWTYKYILLREFIFQHGRLPRRNDRQRGFAVGNWLRGQKYRAMTRRGKVTMARINKHPLMKKIIDHYIARNS